MRELAGEGKLTVAPATRTSLSTSIPSYSQKHKLILNQLEIAGILRVLPNRFFVHLGLGPRVKVAGTSSNGSITGCGVL